MFNPRRHAFVLSLCIAFASLFLQGGCPMVQGRGGPIASRNSNSFPGGPSSPGEGGPSGGSTSPGPGPNGNASGTWGLVGHWVSNYSTITMDCTAASCTLNGTQASPVTLPPSSVITAVNDYAVVPDQTASNIIFANSGSTDGNPPQVFCWSGGVVTYVMDSANGWQATLFGMDPQDEPFDVSYQSVSSGGSGTSSGTGGFPSLSHPVGAGGQYQYYYLFNSLVPSITYSLRVPEKLTTTVLDGTLNGSPISCKTAFGRN